MKNKLKVLDLFSGCGGLSYGFVRAGFDVVAGIDNWKDSLITFERNHPGSKGILMDLGNFDPKNLEKITGKIDVVVGGPPCQGFSISGKRNPNDPRNGLYTSFVKTVKQLRPKAFVLENVPNLVAMSGGKIKNKILKDFTALGYEVKYKVMLASDYGVPQNRRRVVFVGTLGHNSFIFPEPTFSDPESKATAGQAISDLPEGSVKDGTENKKKPVSDYQAKMRKKSNKIFNHEITNHDQKTTDIIALVPDGGNYKDLPDHLKNTRRVNIAWTRYSSNKPSFTIDTGHRHHFHYKWNRIPTVRESARLQSFPDDFVFMGSKTSQYKQVGNAVPPLMAEQIAKALAKALNKKI
ncbi:MAG: DNA cytosine methyltransferase [Candidatus Azambacteria bacterium]|nr:DNA cytosine methyltransferase [Candidatus Azambacteria bacterium]